jgi:Zn-dependent protease
VAGFLVGGIVWAVRPLLPLDALPMRVLVGDLLWVNIGWGALNLIPMYPLDGGHVLRSVLHAVRGPDDRLPLKISIGIGVAAAALALLNGWLWAGFLAGLLTFENVRLLRQLGA